MKAGKKDRVFEIVTTVLLVMILIVALYPLYFSLIASISSPRAVYQGRVLFLPADVTLDGYRKIFADESIWTGFGNGLLYTIVGTLLNVVFTIPLAYALSRKEFPFGGVFMKIMVFTMYFYGGIIPLYFVVKQMGMLDSIWSIVLPTLISTYNRQVLLYGKYTGRTEGSSIFRRMRIRGILLSCGSASVEIADCSHGTFLCGEAVEFLFRAHDLFELRKPFSAAAGASDHSDRQPEFTGLGRCIYGGGYAAAG